MKSPKNYIIAVLALAAIGGGVLAWQQYQELVGLRANALSGETRDAMQKRLAAAEKRARDLESQLAALRGQAADDAAAALADDGTPATGANNGGRGNRGNRGNQQFAALQALMQKPEVQKLLSVQQKAALDARYAALFKGLNLTPDQLDKFKGLLLDKQNAMMDAMAAARQQGVNPRTDPNGFSQIVSSAQADVENSIKATLGDAAYNQYQQYQQTMPQRNLVNQLQQSLSYTGAPLNDDQASQLVQILAQTAPQRANAGAGGGAGLGGGGGYGGGFGGGGGGLLAAAEGGGGGGRAGGGTVPITNEAVTLSQGVLSAPQVQALQQLQQQQQAQQQLQQLMRQSLQGQNGGGNGGGTRRAAGG